MPGARTLGFGRPRRPCIQECPSMNPQGTPPWTNRHPKHNQRSASTELNVTAPGPSHCLTWTGLGRDPARLNGRMPGNGRISRARRAAWDGCPARRTVRGESGGPLTLHRCLAQPRPARVQDQLARQRKDPRQARSRVGAISPSQTKYPRKARKKIQKNGAGQGARS